MTTSLNVQISKPASEGVVDMFLIELRTRLQSIAEITEMIHSVIYQRACRFTGEHLVTGETMQMSSSAEQHSSCSMDHYLQKTYYKTASLISNSCKSIALLTGQTAEVAMLAYEYGKNLVRSISSKGYNCLLLTPCS